MFACVACSRSHGPKYAGKGARPAYISKSDGWRRPKNHENHVRRVIGPQKVEGRSGRGSGRHGRANGHLERPSTFGNFYHLVSILFESSSKVRGLLTFREAMAGVDPKNMKIT